VNKLSVKFSFLNVACTSACRLLHNEHVHNLFNAQQTKKVVSLKRNSFNTHWSGIKNLIFCLFEGPSAKLFLRLQSGFLSFERLYKKSIYSKTNSLNDRAFPALPPDTSSKVMNGVSSTSF
jgi:hypothetical protein